MEDGAGGRGILAASRRGLSTIRGIWEGGGGLSYELFRENGQVMINTGM